MLKLLTIFSFPLLMMLAMACHQNSDEKVQKQEERQPTDLIHDDLKYRETRDLPDGEEAYQEDPDK
jgi:hypothetical protein